MRKIIGFFIILSGLLFLLDHYKVIRVFDKKNIIIDQTTFKELFENEFKELKDRKLNGIESITFIHDPIEKEKYIIQIILPSNDNNYFDLYKKILRYYISLHKNSDHDFSSISSFALVVGYSNELKSAKSVMLGSKVIRKISDSLLKSQDNSLLVFLKKECSNKDPQGSRSEYCMIRY